MSVLGIDFGNDACYIAVARAGGIETLANDYSLRETPSCVALGEKNRVMGVAAKNQQVTNIKNTLFNFKRLLGRKFDDPVAQAELQQIPAKSFRLKDGGIGLQVSYLGQEQIFTPVQLSAMMFTKMQEIAETALKQKMGEAVICVPSFYTDVERRALLDAAKIAGINVLKLMNETAAAALCYGIYKQDLPAPEEKPRNVVFVDMGHTSLQVCGASFNKGKLKISACVSDPGIGGRDFDNVVAKHFNEEFKTKFKLDASNKPRAWLRLTQEVEKLKKQMSANSTLLPMNIECFIDEKDVSGKLKRSDMEDMCKHLLQRAEAVMRKLLEDTHWRTDDIYAVELVGGSTRIPAIKQLVQKVFNKESSTTLNQDEAVSRGCALQCAMLSPNFKVREFVVHDIQQYPIDLHWGTGNLEEGNMEVFNRYHQVPFSKVLTFYRKEPFYLEAKYNSSVPYPDRNISRFYINKVCPNANGESATVKVKVRINLHGLFSVCNAFVVEKREVGPDQDPMETDQTNGSTGDDLLDDLSRTDGIVRVENDADSPARENNQQPDAADQNAETNAKNEQNSTSNSENAAADKKTGQQPANKKPKYVVKHVDLPIEDRVAQLSKTEITDLADHEAKMMAWDKQEKDRVDAKNALEEYVYEMRDKVSEELSQYISDKDKSELQKKLQETEDWLYDEGEDQRREVYNKKLQELQAYGEPAKDRKRELEERPKALEEMHLAIQLASKVIDLYEKKDERFAHLEPEEISKLEKMVREKMQWFEQRTRELSNLQLFQNPSILTAQIRQEKDLFNSAVHPITKKPKPKLEPPPAAPTEENKDQQPGPGSQNEDQQQANKGQSQEQKMETN